MPKDLAHGVEFRTCGDGQCRSRVAAAVEGQFLAYNASLVADAANRADQEDQQPSVRAAAAPSDAARPLSSYTDKELADEIYRRGWEGTLTKSLKVG